MIKKMLFTAGIITSIALTSGCATDPQLLTPAQVVGMACPPAQGAIAQFEAIAATIPDDPRAVKAGTLLAQATPVVTAMCASGATVATDDVQDFAQTALPALATVAGTLPLAPSTLQAVQGGLVAAEIAVGAAGVVAQNIAAAKAAQPAGTPKAETAH